MVLQSLEVRNLFRHRDFIRKKCFMINLCDSLVERHFTLIAVHYANEFSLLFIKTKYLLRDHTAVPLV